MTLNSKDAGLHNQTHRRFRRLLNATPLHSGLAINDGKISEATKPVRAAVSIHHAFQVKGGLNPEGRAEADLLAVEALKRPGADKESVTKADIETGGSDADSSEPAGQRIFEPKALALAMPQAGETVLRFVLPKKLREATLGDLEEDYREQVRHMSRRTARVWYWKEVFCILVRTAPMMFWGMLYAWILVKLGR